MLVVGIGNPDRGDDAVGPRVVEALGRVAPEGVRLHVLGGDLLDLLEVMHGADRVILVDAMRSGGDVGHVRRIDASTAPGAVRLADFVSTHVFNLAEAIELARTLGRLPASLVIYGIEGATFDPGAPMGPEVTRAVATVVARIVEEI